MLAWRIIPCLDVRDGRVVKGVKFRDHVDMGDISNSAGRAERVEAAHRNLVGWMGLYRRKSAHGSFFSKLR